MSRLALVLLLSFLAVPAIPAQLLHRSEQISQAAEALQPLLHALPGNAMQGIFMDYAITDAERLRSDVSLRVTSQTLSESYLKALGKSAMALSILEASYPMDHRAYLLSAYDLEYHVAELRQIVDGARERAPGLHRFLVHHFPELDEQLATIMALVRLIADDAQVQHERLVQAIDTGVSKVLSRTSSIPACQPSGSDGKVSEATASDRVCPHCGKPVHTAR